MISVQWEGYIRLSESDLKVGIINCLVYFCGEHGHRMNSLTYVFIYVDRTAGAGDVKPMNWPGGVKILSHEYQLRI